MIILGVESSCDETAIAIVRDGREVLSSVIASQTATHAKWGGVVPEIAAREHAKVLEFVYTDALKIAHLQTKDIDAIAVTQGPGLIGCLLVGVSFSKGLAQTLNRPLIPVNHVHAHVHGALLGVTANFDDVFPCIALVASGGHTNLYYMENPTNFVLLAHTIDDACGESFDKVGKMLGLPYPGGPHVETLALQGDVNNCQLPTMMERKNLMAFSYSGLKTAVANQIKSQTTTSSHADLAAAFQEEAIGQLVRKISQSVKDHPQTKSIVVSGGVAANSRFKSLLSAAVTTPYFFPPLSYCSDNGAMIAALGYYEIKQKTFEDSLNWDVFSRYPFEQFKRNSESDNAARNKEIP